MDKYDQRNQQPNLITKQQQQNAQRLQAQKQIFTDITVKTESKSQNLLKLVKFTTKKLDFKLNGYQYKKSLEEKENSYQEEQNRYQDLLAQKKQANETNKGNTNIKDQIANTKNLMTEQDFQISVQNVFKRDLQTLGTSVTKFTQQVNVIIDNIKKQFNKNMDQLGKDVKNTVQQIEIDLEKRKKQKQKQRTILQKQEQIKRQMDALFQQTVSLEKEGKEIIIDCNKEEKLAKITAQYQWLKCLQCNAQNNGKMIICSNHSNPNRNDAYSKNGYSALCQSHKSFIRENTGTSKLHLGKPTSEQIKLAGITTKYQYLKCRQCGNCYKGKMIICSNDYNPNRNDQYGKDGYSALCQSHKYKVGQQTYYKKLHF